MLLQLALFGVPPSPRGRRFVTAGGSLRNLTLEGTAASSGRWQTDQGFRGRVMSLLLYVAVLLVSVSSVLFGLGWVSAPEPRYEAPPAQFASHAPAQPVAAKGEARAALSPVYPAAPGAPQADTTKPAVTSAPLQAAATATTTGADHADAAPSAVAAAMPAPIAAARSCRRRSRRRARLRHPGL